MKLDLDASKTQAKLTGEAPGFSRRTVAGGFTALVAALVGSGVARAATDASVGKQYRPASLGTDYADTDSAYYDPNYPPLHFPHIYMSQGKPIQSFMWLANGPEAKGCVILSPQRYGGDCLDSLIPALTGAGINVLRFNPRGMFDGGEYSFTTALEDLHAAVAFLRENNGQHVTPPGVVYHPREFKIDLDKIAVLGKSGGGGMMGWIGTAENPGLSTAITVAPNVLVPLPFPPEAIKMFSDLKKSTAGRIDLDNELKKLTPADYVRFDMHKAAKKLVGKNVLLIGQSNHEYVNDLHIPLVNSMKDAGAKHFAQVILEGDDYFLTARIAMTRLVISWLKSECGF